MSLKYGTWFLVNHFNALITLMLSSKIKKIIFINQIFQGKVNKKGTDNRIIRYSNISIEL
jgi:hypothetical protein